MRTEVLDHGYLELVESWGSDERIVEAARMSTDKGFKGWGRRQQCEYCGLSEDEIRNTPAWMECASSGSAHHFGPYGPPGDEKLLAFLYSHKHMTPFEMAGMTIEVQAPIFVFREWHRHRTQSYNELSARYTPLPDVNYVPTVERCMMTGGGNKQAQGLKEIHRNEAETFIQDLTRSYADCEAQYQSALLAGVPKELARLILPVGRYSRMRASANLRNWLAFLTLRMDENAQWEIRQYANEVAKLIETQFPRTYELFAGQA
jgi:thymidylate synthase (FAD)